MLLVLEAGGADRRLAVAMPAASFLLALGNPRYDWAYKAEPDPTRSGRRDLMPRGKVLGGTSAINGMSYVRGQPADYDAWAAQGCRGWDFESVLPCFKRAEDNENGADAFHGTGGPARGLQPPHPAPRSRRPTSNPASPTACPAWPISTRRRRRASATCRSPSAGGGGGARPALTCALRWGRRNLRVLTHAHVRRVLFDGKRATGVEYSRHGRTERAEAARAVIVSAGAFASPQLLMLSGIGPAAHVSEHGVPVVHDLPESARTFRTIRASPRPAGRT